jgi:hypothetical protein
VKPDPDIAQRIVEAVREYARRNPSATWQTIAAELDATLDAQSADWLRHHPELTLAALSGE